MLTMKFHYFFFNSEDTRLLLPVWFPRMCLLLLPYGIWGLWAVTGFLLASSHAIISHVLKILACLSDPPGCSGNLPMFILWKKTFSVIQVKFNTNHLRTESSNILSTWQWDAWALHRSCISRLHLHRFVLSVISSWAPKSSITQKTEC